MSFLYISMFTYSRLSRYNGEFIHLIEQSIYYKIFLRQFYYFCDVISDRTFHCIWYSLRSYNIFRMEFERSKIVFWRWKRSRCLHTNGFQFGILIFKSRKIWIWKLPKFMIFFFIEYHKIFWNTEWEISHCTTELLPTSVVIDRFGISMYIIQTRKWKQSDTSGTKRSSKVNFVSHLKRIIIYIYLISEFISACVNLVLWYVPVFFLNLWYIPPDQSNVFG